jgi:hypothetical protein
MYEKGLRSTTRRPTNPPEPSATMQPALSPTTIGPVPNATRPLMILIAGPYRGGTGDDPEKMAANLRRLEEASWPLFAAGHIPMIGEWVALPVWRSAGGSEVGDVRWNEVQYPTAARLIERCDAVLRLPGESTGADNDVRLARTRGIPVYFRVEEVPGVVS